MKDKQVKRYKSGGRWNQEQINEIMDALFTEYPTENTIAKAQASLQSSLAKTKESAIVYGSMDHPTTNTLHLAMRKNKVIAINFGIIENVFVTQVENRFGTPVYFAPDLTEAAIEQVRNYLDGKRANFDLPTDISILTDFQQQVLEATQQIPRGRIATYLEIARKIGNPKAVRAVGQALGGNPIPIVIPCHRVIASNGSLGGYSGGGGPETKAKLLQLEGAFMGGF
jgi:methylated-DNA-[protein]-cysteine S-methyltransferase